VLARRLPRLRHNRPLVRSSFRSASGDMTGEPKRFSATQKSFPAPGSPDIMATSQTVWSYAG
jgi:hypothetical protein